MSPAAGLLFAAILAMAIATPGPSTAALVGRVLVGGLGGVGRLCAGLVLGDLFWLLCAVSGVAVLAHRAGDVFVLIRYLGAAYLLYVAWRLWRAAPASARDEGGRDASRPLLAGMALSLGNPKTMIFYLAVLPGVVAMDALAPADVLVLLAIATVVAGTVLAAYALLAERLRRHLDSPSAVARINRGSALLMVCAAAAIATR